MKRSIFFFFRYIILAFIFLIVNNCKEEQVYTVNVTVTTNQIKNVNAYSAEISALIINEGGVKLTEFGFCWSTKENPTINNEHQAMSKRVGLCDTTLIKFQPLTKYFIRAYAIYNSNVIYGESESFTTLSASGTLTDADNNIYNYITIGTQTWMTENLRTSKYRDGTSIPNVTERFQWVDTKDGAWCNYDNYESRDSIYGKLYNWYAVNNIKKLAPIGWHIPTDREWITLEFYMSKNGYNYDKSNDVNKIAKSMASKSYWKSYDSVGAIGNNLTLNNSSGFSGLPGGSRLTGYIVFSNINTTGFWWSATECNPDGAWGRYLNYSYNALRQGVLVKNGGFSVRCVRD